VSVHSFVLFMALGAGALALWVESRFALFPADWRRVFLHLVAAVLVIYLVTPKAGGAIQASGTPAAQPLTAMGVALPAVTYLLLASLWTLKLAQRLLPGAR
jgi:hypothetical protein